MKKILAALAMTAVLVSPVLAQTYGNDQNTNNNNTTNPSNTNTGTNTNTNDMNNPNNTNTMDNNTTTTDTDTNDGSLPATASFLPLLTLGGLASLGAGLWIRRRRRA